jgi:hypothetical protein
MWRTTSEDTGRRCGLQAMEKASGGARPVTPQSWIPVSRMSSVAAPICDGLSRWQEPD